MEGHEEMSLRAAVACEYMATGYDLIDVHYDHGHEPAASDGLMHSLPAGVTLLLLAQEQLAHLDLPAERRARALAVLARAGRRAFAGQVRNLAAQRAPSASQDAILTVLRTRSGSLAAAPCLCAALLAGAHWRTVGLAGRFGVALGCAGQLEDDLDDLAEDEQSGKKTVPILLKQLNADAPEVAEATTLVLIRSFLQEAAAALRRLPLPHCRTEALWTLLPPYLVPNDSAC
jgi:geranylgeranyl pyrophosphate synthase